MLDTDEYRQLIIEALPAATDADTVPPTAQTLFTPQQHRRALDPDVTVVLGGRGVGKTAWFEALQDHEMRMIAADQYDLPSLGRVETFPGFGAASSPHYPGSRTLGSLVENFSPVDIWTAVALHGFELSELLALTRWQQRVEWVVGHPEEVDEAFAEMDERVRAQGKTSVMLFDALDRLHQDRHIADKLAGGALQLALNLRISTRSLRAKVFLRHDMFDSASTNFPDASKLVNNRVDLRWDRASLYSLLFHLLSVAPDPRSEAFCVEASWVPYKAGSQEELEQALHCIASEYMGANHRKGYTYTWIPNHLQDGLGHTSPRSFLSALSYAAGYTRNDYPEHNKALHWEAIRRGVQQASKLRVAEVKEDMPWVANTLDPLQGQQVPIEVETVMDLWEGRGLTNALRERRNEVPEDAALGEKSEVRTGPVGIQAQELIDDLKELGIFTTRADGRLDLPDVYRIASEVGRKGGVPLAKS